MILEACPFCGGLNLAYDKGEGAIVCLDCVASGPFGFKEKENIKVRAECLWNKRHLGWIDATKELPDDNTTVLICNLAAWDEPVQAGYHDGEFWYWEHLDVPLDGIDCAGGNDCMTQPPTHWMHFPEPPGVAQVPHIPAPAKAERPMDYRVAYPDNPFAVEGGITCGVEDCCRMIKDFDAKKCLDALNLPDNGKVVTKALETRLRAIAKANTPKK